MSIATNIVQLGLAIPNLEPSSALFRPYTLHGQILTVSGQLPISAGKVIAVGSVPEEVSVEAARDAARLCVVNVLAAVKDALCGDWERISAITRIAGYVATSRGFADAPSIINAASELLLRVFGDRGNHARLALGVASLPFGAPVELEASFIIEPK